MTTNLLSTKLSNKRFCRKNRQIPFFDKKVSNYFTLWPLTNEKTCGLVMIISPQAALFVVKYYSCLDRIRTGRRFLKFLVGVEVIGQGDGEAVLVEQQRRVKFLDWGNR